MPDLVARLVDTGQALAALDVSGRVRAWNARATALSGWASDTAVGRPLYDLLVGRSRLELVDGLERLASGRRWQAYLELEGPRGKVLRVEVCAEPVRIADRVIGSLAVLRALSPAESERRLQELTTALQTVPDAVLVVDEQARVREWNPAAEALFGWPRTQMLGAPVTRIIPPPENERFQNVWSQLAAGQEPLPYHAHRVDRGGRQLLVRVHTAGYRDRGAFAGAVATYRELPSVG